MNTVVHYLLESATLLLAGLCLLKVRAARTKLDKIEQDLNRPMPEPLATVFKGAAR